MAFFLQKPPVERIRELSTDHAFFLDSGVWLFSRRAIDVLLRKCGWNRSAGKFRGGVPSRCELYAGIGPALGRTPATPDPRIRGLTSAVLPLADARFYHFGTNRSLLTSLSALQRPPSDRRSFGHAGADSATVQIVQHSRVLCPVSPAHGSLWIENCDLPAGWALARDHVLTGIPRNDWSLRLSPGVCLDLLPIDRDRFCIRAYGFDDTFSGAIGDARTLWLGAPAAAWFSARGIRLAEAGLRGDADNQKAAIFPIVSRRDLHPRWLEWLFAAAPASDAAFRATWLTAPRASAHDLLRTAALGRLWRQRGAHVDEAMARITAGGWLQLCPQLDLARTAGVVVREKLREPPRPRPQGSADDLPLVHDRMFRAGLRFRKNPARAAAEEREAFALLRRLIVRRMEQAPVRPARNLLDDQIIWGRSPVRLDIAGGWTDTPPYCIEHGGRVVNAAVTLNGQPPIQVFGRICGEPEIRIRSIDLGLDERIGSYAALRRYGILGSGFGIAKAALALAGFEPRFHARNGCRTLRDQLHKEFGGGIELSLLAAVPKGSGLGTSSILAATLLGVLNELCGLAWTPAEVSQRTLALEQMLTSGGGWQDQVGGLFRGLKLIETAPGLEQKPTVRWLPGAFFQEGFANRLLLLYYTGITRTAHDILGEIVRGVFLNAEQNLGLIEDIGWNARFAADAFQRHDWSAFCEAVRRSWMLNQLLDRGTNPPAVRAILARIGDCAAAAKLLGAGGGGYLMILARDEDCGARIRRALAAEPPNAKARFVDLGLSDEGFQATRS